LRKDKIGFIRSKPLAILGAGAKGAAFLNLIDLKAELIDFAIDINPRRRGLPKSPMLQLANANVYIMSIS
jgi:hypothetical protein